jgi:hypothetical protein
MPRFHSFHVDWMHRSWSSMSRRTPNVLACKFIITPCSLESKFLQSYWLRLDMLPLLSPSYPAPMAADDRIHFYQVSTDVHRQGAQPLLFQRSGWLAIVVWRCRPTSDWYEEIPSFSSTHNIIFFPIILASVLLLTLRWHWYHQMIPKVGYQSLKTRNHHQTRMIWVS